VREESPQGVGKPRGGEVSRKAWKKIIGAEKTTDGAAFIAGKSYIEKTIVICDRFMNRIPAIWAGSLLKTMSANIKSGKERILGIFLPFPFQFSS
jgi:hypothetical protein